MTTESDLQPGWLSIPVIQWLMALLVAVGVAACFLAFAMAVLEPDDHPTSIDYPKHEWNGWLHD